MLLCNISLALHTILKPGKSTLPTTASPPPTSTHTDLDPITLRHLGSHTSEIGRDWPTNSVDGWPDVPENSTVRQWPTRDQQLQAIAESPLIAPPGFLPIHSNTSFSMLGGALVAAASKAEGNTLIF
jgi:CubicO group peptidase (beta-lactamase class C family)